MLQKGKSTVKRKLEKPQMWRFDAMLLNNRWVQGTTQNRSTIRNENDNMTCQNLGDRAKVVIRGNFASVQAYLKK